MSFGAVHVVYKSGLMKSPPSQDPQYGRLMAFWIESGEIFDSWMLFVTIYAWNTAFWT